mgnify:CR=1 FL=1
MRSSLLRLPRRYKRVLQVAADVVLVWAALWLAFLIRLEAVGPIEPFGGHAWLFLLAPVVTLPFFVVLGLYRAVLRYVGRHALITIGKAVTLATMVLFMVVLLMPAQEVVVPRSVPVIYWGTAMLLLGGLRLLMRNYFVADGVASPSGERKPRVRVVPRPQRPAAAIYGAGTAGNQIVSGLRAGNELRPVAFVDDDPSLWNTVVGGLPVYAPHDIGRMLAATGATEMLLAIPSAPRRRRREILALLDPYPVHVRTLPGLKALCEGSVKVEDLRDVEIDDLLGRAPVAPERGLFERCIVGQAVMVTGAGGAIGSELCRQIVTCRPRALVLFEHSEFALYSIQTELERVIRSRGLAIELVGILGSVRNNERMLDALNAWRVDTVYHAAAYKHVPIVEHNVAQGFFNNTMGTLLSAQAAIRAGVSNFVLISTDKAVRPTNVMGATKRLAELVLQALAAERAPVLFREEARGAVENRTRFTMVRFGNVLGSSGSVIPLFREQIRSGGPVTVTDPRMTRYFMTIPEAAQLVIQAGSMGEGGDVFVLDMGEPVKIVELAERIVHLSGLTVRSNERPEGDIEILFTGLRPGEKLYEELLIGDNVLPTAHPMIMRATEERLPWSELVPALQSIVEAIQHADYPRVRELLQALVSGYTPDERLVDLIYTRRAGLEDAPSAAA